MYLWSTPYCSNREIIMVHLDNQRLPHLGGYLRAYLGVACVAKRPLASSGVSLSGYIDDRRVGHVRKHVQTYDTQCRLSAE